MAYGDLLAGYGERYRRLYLFEPLYKLERMKKKDAQDRPIDMRGLGMLALLYFFEQKIMRYSKAGKKQLAQFLYSVTKEQFELDEQEYYVIAKTIIEAFRPGSGEREVFQYYNWEKHQHETVSYQYLKAGSYDLETQEQFYSLDDHGLELVFATKEFYSEFQLSISQLVLRKQLEKGEFKGALRQINEMRVAVETIESRLEQMRSEIKRNIVSNDIFERYQQTIEDTHYRLKSEHEEFNELHQFLKDAKERLYYQDTSKKERETYQLVLKINYELEAVHAYHTSLLEKCLQVKNDALDAAKESLYQIGMNTFNFDKDILARIVSTPLPVDAMIAMVAPFLSIEQNKQWSLLTILGRQQVYEERAIAEQTGYLSVDEEQEQLAEQRVIAIYKGIITLLISYLQQHKSCTLQQFIEDLEQSVLTETRYFYDLFLLLHQCSPIGQGDIKNREGHLWSMMEQMIGHHELHVTELQEVIQVNNRFVIQNMQLQLGDVEDEL